MRRDMSREFDDWFRSKQGEPYDSMYVFARDAWNASQAAEGLAVLKTILEVFDIMNNPAQFRAALESAVAKREPKH